MALHLMKLCVGARVVEDLRQWQERQRRLRAARGRQHLTVHHTRHAPKRRTDLEGGSLYWVFNGLMLARQRLVEIGESVDEAGERKCALALDPEIVLTEPQPRRPFQGWRYLKAEDAPPDLQAGRSDAAMPEDMRRELALLGLL